MLGVVDLNHGRLDFSPSQCKNPRQRHHVFVSKTNSNGGQRCGPPLFDHCGRPAPKRLMKENREHFSYLIVIALLLALVGMISSCSMFRSRKAEFKPDIQTLPAQLSTYAPMVIPADNQLTPEKVALGRELFFDERLSGDGKLSCYSCHVCEKGLTDGLAKAEGAYNKQLPRSSPTLWNIGYHHDFYWDGRSASLEKQAMAAWTGANMGAKPDDILKKISALDGYRQQFQKVFGGGVTPDHVVKAIASFERTIISGDT